MIPWKQLFRTIYKTTIDSYSRIFQLKIFYKIIATKKKLYCCNIAQSPVCRFCNDEEEDQMHLFFYCPYVASFWTSIQNWLKPLNICFKFVPLNVIFGDPDENCPQIMNTIILLGKIFIFKTQSRINLNISYFKNVLRNQFLLEEIIATNHCKLEQHNMKWEQVCCAERWGC